jgi:hypothetical protein
MKKTIKLRESEIISLIKQVLNEQYDSEKLHSRDYVVFKLRQGPREL